jgi:hypothetical protein
MLLPSRALADEPTPPEIVGVRVGFFDRYKVGLWTPVTVTLRGGSKEFCGRVTASVPDGDGVPSLVANADDDTWNLPAGEERAAQLFVRFGRVDSSLKIEFRVGEEVVAQQVLTTAARADDEHFPPGLQSRKLVVAVGPAGLYEPLHQAAVLQRLPVERRVEVTRVEDLGPLPTRWYGYEGIDTVLLSTSRPDIFAGLEPGDERLQALDEWIRLGGRLVVCVGAKAEDVLGDRSALGQFVPGTLDKVVSLRQTGALESYCRSSVSVFPAGGGERTGMRVPRLKVDAGAAVEVREADLPLVIRQARGLGQIVVLAADLDAGPLAAWSDNGLLAARLLDLPPAQLDEAQHNVPLMHHGYNDLAGQLRSALDRFDGVRSFPFWAVALLVSAYIVLVGPIDYLLVHKVFRRVHWTWVTFPLVVVATCAAAWVLAHAMKGRDIRTHQVELLDVDVAAGRVRGTVWTNIFSPRSEAFRLTFRPRLPDGDEPRDARVLAAWLGLPGSGLGGMNPSGTDPLLQGGEYWFSPALDTLEGVPIAVCSTKSLTARWTAAGGEWPAAELADDGQSIHGSITNTFDFPLEHCVLIYDRWSYDLGTIKAKDAAPVGAESKRSELKTFLTGRRLVADDKDKYRQETTPYDPSSTDVYYILRAMMFHEAAGAQRYTGLTNDYQGFLDLSGLLRTGRAVLVAQAPVDARGKVHCTELLRDGQPLDDAGAQRSVMYRFVFPVEGR